MLHLSIIIPAYNEENRLPQTLNDIASYLKNLPLNAEVIVVDDGSTDNTSGAALNLADRIPNLRVFAFTENRGKGHAVQQGMLAAEGEYILFMDADNSTPISEIEKLMPFISFNEVVIGSRNTGDSDVVIPQPRYRQILGRIGNALVHRLAVKGINDTQCGFKLFQRRACKRIFTRQQTTGWGFDIEILTIAQRVLGYRIKEVGVTWFDAPGSKVRPLRDGWRTLKELLRISYNFSTGQYQRPAYTT